MHDMQRILNYSSNDGPQFMFCGDNFHKKIWHICLYLSLIKDKNNLGCYFIVINLSVNIFRICSIIFVDK